MASKRKKKEYQPGERFGAPFVSRMWHADGTPFTDDEYRAAGMKPPTAQQQRTFAERDKVRTPRVIR